MNVEWKQKKRKREIRRKRFLQWLINSILFGAICLFIGYGMGRKSMSMGSEPEDMTVYAGSGAEAAPVYAGSEPEDVTITNAGPDVENEKRYSESDSDDRNGEWNLILVNQQHLIDEDYIAGISLTKLRNGQSVDSRCYPDLQQMMDDCRAEGYTPMICSSFRTYQKQQKLFEKQVQVFLNQGMGRQDAETEAAKSVAAPGTSEHELGLAVDITDVYNQQLISGMESLPVQKWLAENCWKYGFILRYPADKSDITGISYEPWHYRYVGYEAAKYIYENQITLEEYLSLDGKDTFLIFTTLLQPVGFSCSIIKRKNGGTG